VLGAVRSQALDAGVRIAVENHPGDMQAREGPLLRMSSLSNIFGPQSPSTMAGACTGPILPT